MLVAFLQAWWPRQTWKSLCDEGGRARHSPGQTRCPSRGRSWWPRREPGSTQRRRTGLPILPPGSLPCSYICWAFTYWLFLACLIPKVTESKLDKKSWTTFNFSISLEKHDPLKYVASLSSVWRFRNTLQLEVCDQNKVITSSRKKCISNAKHI